MSTFVFDPGGNCTVKKSDGEILCRVDWEKAESMIKIGDIIVRSGVVAQRTFLGDRVIEQNIPVTFLGPARRRQGKHCPLPTRNGAL